MLVVGAGLSGATVARVPAEAGHEALVLEKHAHPGGNAFDEPDAAGVLVAAALHLAGELLRRWQA